MADSIKIGELVYKVTGDASGLKAALQNVDVQLEKTSTRASKFGAMLTAALSGAAVISAGKKIVSFFSDAVDAASDAEETANKFGVVYRDIATTANNAALNIANSFGVAQTEAKKLLGDTGDLLTGFGFTQEAALDLSDKVVQLGLDLSSFANVDQQFAVEGLRKALLGETEQAKSLGIVINQTTKEFQSAVKQKQKDLNITAQQAKAMTILEIATTQSKNAIGDFARSSMSYANQQKILNARFKDFTIAAGGPVKDALKLIQRDMMMSSDEAKTFGDNIGQIAGKAILAFRMARDATLLWLGEFDLALAKLNFKVNMAIAETAKALNIDSVARKFANFAETNLVAWAESEQEIKKYNARLEESKAAWDELGKNPEVAADNTDKLKDATADAGGAAEDLKKKWEEAHKKITETLGNAVSIGNQLNSVLSAGAGLTDALYEKRLEKIDAQMEAELRAAGVAEETQVEQAQREYDAAVATGDALDMEEKRRALEKAKILEKFEKKRAEIEYKGALAAWQFQVAQASLGVPIATMQGLITGWGAGWPAGVVLGPLFAALAGSAAALQLAGVIASKPTPPKFAEGGIVPGTSMQGDRVPVLANSGEMILTQEQQKKLLNGGTGQVIHIHNYIAGTAVGDAIYRMTQDGLVKIDKRAVV